MTQDLKLAVPAPLLVPSHTPGDGRRTPRETTARIPEVAAVGAWALTAQTHGQAQTEAHTCLCADWCILMLTGVRKACTDSHTRTHTYTHVCARSQERPQNRCKAHLPQSETQLLTITNPSHRYWSVAATGW